jgi:hypothetical protein
MRQLSTTLLKAIQECIDLVWEVVQMADGKVDAPQGYDRFLWTADFLDDKKGNTSHPKEKTILGDSKPVDWAVIGKHLPGKHDQSSHGRKRGGRLNESVPAQGRPRASRGRIIEESGEAEFPVKKDIEPLAGDNGDEEDGVFILDDTQIVDPEWEKDVVAKEVWGDLVISKRGKFGRPGKRGGSAKDPSTKVEPKKKPKTPSSSIAGYPEDAKAITPEMRMKQATSKDIEAQMKKNLREIGAGAPKLNTVEGKLDKANVDKIIDNMKKELDTYSSYLAGDTSLRMRDYMDHMRNVLGSKDLRGQDAKNIDDLMRDSVQRIVHQEVESNRQQFTDHGIRHIVGNILRQDQIAMTMANGHVSGMDRLTGAFIMVHHDVGYTVPLVREGGERGVRISGDHKKFSEKILGEQKSRWDEGNGVFDSARFDSILKNVGTHDASTIDSKDIIGTSTRLSDNLALFNNEKLPGMFRYVQGGQRSIIAMGNAAKGTYNKEKKKYEWDSTNVEAFEAERKKLYTNIDAANLNPALKRDLKASVKEISYMTPKFTLGVLAGEISGIKKTAGKINIDIEFNAYDKLLQNYFDMGQKQAKKLLEDYGHKDFTKATYDLGNGVILNLIGGTTGVKKEIEVGSPSALTIGGIR